MLQPRSYPEYVAKALVLDDEPFQAMVDDDNPWMEGIVLVTTVSLLAGIALAVGGFLTAATLPDPAIALNALLQGWRQFASVTSLPPSQVEAIIADLWTVAAAFSGYAGSWSHFLPIITLPILTLLWWIFFGIVAFGVARAMGGQGSLNATMGASALIVAPLVFHVAAIVPFAGVSGMMVSIWGMLIGYRAIHISHELTWRSAAWATVIVYLAALVALLLVTLAFSAGYAAGGYQ